MEALMIALRALKWCLKWTVAVLLIVTMAFLPTGLALARNSNNVSGVFIMNVFFFVGIPWLIALHMALQRDKIYAVAP